MGRIYDAMLKFFKEDDWPIAEIEGKPLIRTAFSGDNGRWSCFAQAREEQEQFIFYSILEAHVPEDKRQVMAEFITRANYGMVIGNFEQDFSDGEIRYKTSVDVEGCEITSSLIKNLVYTNARLMDRYLPGIMKVIYGGATPEVAIKEIEG